MSIEELEKKLATYEKKLDDNKQKPSEVSKGASFVVGELVAGISVGSIIGYYLDQYLHTKILFLLIFVILGLISSMYNIYKKSK